MTARFARYVPHHRALDFMAAGWLPTAALAGCHHGFDSVLMLWMCACPVALPSLDATAAQPAADAQAQP